jgi:ribose transport system ATP-binding protein
MSPHLLASKESEVSDQTDNIVEMRQIVKDFPGVRALDHVDFTIQAGEIHGLVGENGAGKSTLIKILAGVYQRDSGEIKIRGQRYGTLTPRQVEDLGIQFIHQERYLVPHFNVAQSIFLGREIRISPLPVVDNRSMCKQAQEFMEKTLGVALQGNALIRDLSVAQAQIVQIAKALIANPSMIVLDEPTAPLARREVLSLFRILERLTEQNITIIYISHYLQEISEICDRVTVLRNGLNVGTLEVKDTTLDQIVELMVGRGLQEMFPRRGTNLVGEPILSVGNLTRAGVYEGITFEVRRGEVIGITGILGSGCEALVRTLFGLEAPDTGGISFMGQSAGQLSPARAVRRGVALVPRDRRQHGLVINTSVSDNVNLASLDRIAKMGFVRRKVARDRANVMIKSLDIRTPGPETIVRYLSGGNQQKIVLARWLSSDAEIYLLDEPTVGIDVGAKIEIYHLINRLVAGNAGVIFVSSDIPELLGMTDRILVMYRGRIVKTFVSGQATPDVILSWATGGQQEA